MPHGFHYERSPMYHSILFESVLDVANFYKAYSLNIPIEIVKTLAKMKSVLEFFTMKDGQIVLFNDSSFNIAKPTKMLVEYFNNIFGDDRTQNNNSICDGIFKFKNEKTEFYLDLDKIGPDELPGHAHADNLNFELAINGIRVITDRGISTYDDCIDRAYERSSMAHNVLTIDNQNQSDVWSSFRVGRRAISQHKIVKNDTNIEISATHDGYKKLAYKVERKFILNDNVIFISDDVQLKQPFKVVSYLHFSPHVEIKLENKNCIVFDHVNNKLCELIFDKQSQVEVFDTYTSFSYNKKSQSKSLKVTLPQLLNTTSLITIKLTES